MILVCALVTLKKDEEGGCLAWALVRRFVWSSFIYLGRYIPLHTRVRFSFLVCSKKKEKKNGKKIWKRSCVNLQITVPVVIRDFES